MTPTSPQPRAAVYARSIDPVEVGGQVRRMRHLVRERGWEMVGVFTDKGKPSERRPELDGLLQVVASGSVDIIVTTGLDRLGKNAIHIMILVSDLVAQGATIAASTVGKTHKTKAKSEYGDGLVIWPKVKATLSNLLVHDNDRAGVFYSGSSGSLSGSVVEKCQFSVVLDDAATPKMGDDNVFTSNTRDAISFGQKLAMPSAPSPPAIEPPSKTGSGG